MGIEIWALVVLVAVLAVYLLPLLVGRRDLMGLSRSQDRYSGNLRVLATGASVHGADDACADGVHAEIFKYRPEVRAMNRPAVRNVRALRTERELVRARRAHEEGRQRRRVAASRRSVVALVLLGVLAGAVVVGAVTALPWWLSLVPAALLVMSMVEGRQAAVTSAEADRRERRRIARLEYDLARLTGTDPAAAQTPSTQAQVEARRAEASTTTSSQRERRPEQAGAVEHADRAERAGAAEQAGAVEHAGPAEHADRAEHTGRAGHLSWDGHPERDEREPRPSATAEAVTEPTTATPPQGWTPVKVPAPTYTLVAQAPRRAIDSLEESSQPSAPVPVRPVTARAYPEIEEEAEVAAPIDLDAVLERRRAAGA